jgi:hypothetical protein
MSTYKQIKKQKLKGSDSMVRRVIGFELTAENKRRELSFYNLFLDCGHMISETLPRNQSPSENFAMCKTCGGV